MNSRLWNWRLWVGCGLSLLALLGYVWGFEVTRSVTWLSVGVFAVAAWLLVEGIKRAQREPERYRGRRAGPILASVSLVFLVLFGVMTYIVAKHFPVARNAPKVGEKAPQFELVDATGSSVTLKQLLSASASASAARMPRGVLLVFYRGYW